MAATRVKRPTIKPAPMAINPHVFRTSTTYSTLELDVIQSENPERIHFDSIRNPVDDQLGFNNFTMPSYNKCQPIKIRKITKPVNCNEVYVLLSFITSKCFSKLRIRKLISYLNGTIFCLFKSTY